MPLPTETTTLLAQLNEIFPAQNHLRDTFFTETENSTSQYVAIEIHQGERKLAPFVHPLSDSKIDARTDGTAVILQAPYIKLKRPITAVDVQRRLQGENPFMPYSLDYKLNYIATRDMAEMRDQVFRREEWMCAKQMTTGAMTISGEGVSATITLPMLATHKLANTDLIANGWDQSGADPLEDLRVIRRVIAKDSGLTADRVYFGATAWKLFTKNAEVRAWLNIWNLNPGMLQPIAPSSGVQYMGSVEGFQFYTYNEWYKDPDTGTVDPMIPDKKIIVASTAMRAIRKYGAILDLESLVSVDIFPKTWMEGKDTPVYYSSIQSSPLPYVVQVNGFAFAQVQS